ncbi:MAG: 4a-hydroxytetrahydrobiopterin dehydratase [Planctomycetia bacterium]|jgi:4a-hydroxytetrahydrobiopterin dehydratase|nr:4a-hydroxytetrahydrobiopterin dehydratase [Planctomycetia bacterium]
MRTTSRILSSDEATEALDRLVNWRLTPDQRHLERVVECGSFALAIAFVGRVALLAEASRHHPEIDVRHGTVRLALTTAEAGGVTARDTDLADWIERVVP